MRRARRVLPPLSLVAFAPLLSCSAPPPPQTAHVTLGGDVVARVGSVTIPVSLVAKVATASRIDPREATDRLIDDALAAEAAHATGVADLPRFRWATEAILGRVTVDTLIASARAAGPPTDAELEEVTQAHFRELALPEQVKVIHAIVVRPKNAADADRARALAAQLAQAVSGAKDADEFEARAKALPTGGLEVRVERLDPFIADGRTSEGAPGSYEPAFAAGAFAIPRPGETSGVVESSFGWHVIRLLERRPPHFVPVEERRARLTDEIMSHRAQDALEAAFTSARARAKTEILPDALTVMASVSFDAPE